MSVFMSVIAPADRFPGTGAIEKWLADAGVAMTFDPPGTIDMAAGWANVVLGGQATGFGIAVETAAEFPLVGDAAGYGDMVWTTSTKGDFQQFLAALQFLRAVAALSVGAFHDSEKIFAPDNALAEIEMTIAEVERDMATRVAVPAASSGFLRRLRRLELQPLERIVAGLVLGSLFFVGSILAEGRS